MGDNSPDNASLGNKSFRDKDKTERKAAIWISMRVIAVSLDESDRNFNYDVVLRRSCELLAFLVDNFSISYSDIQSANAGHVCKTNPHLFDNIPD